MKKNEKYPGYPHHDKEEDIYHHETKKSIEEAASKNRRKNYGDGLDVPGAELDDSEEDIGSEDEENNYYSLGGDNHEDLEENKS